PAHVSPVTGEHGGEVAVAEANGTIAGPCEGGAGVGVGPCGAAIGGPEHEVGARPGSTPASFVHAGNVYVACDQVTGDLDVTGEAGGDLVRGPSRPVVSGDADEEGAAPDSEVVPGDVHVPIEGAGRVVVGPARLSVVGAAAVNAVMGPASRGGIPGSGGLVPAEAPTAAGQVDPDGKPGAGWAV